MNNNIKYTNTQSIINFIRENDNILDFLAFNYSDIIIPNSQLTYNIINKIYSNEKKINNPIYTTNINYKNNTYFKSFENREYDIMFCCYSWSRLCKNFDLVKKLLKKITQLKIILIGKNVVYDEIKQPNLFYIDNVPNEKMGDYFEKTKVLVIPSYFDSNPNVLIEAINAGCNIVTSKNVGNNEHLNSNLVINNPNDIDEWMEKINNSILVKYDYNGYGSEKIKFDLLKITKKIKPKIMTVGIYKINPLWDNLKDNHFTYFTFKFMINNDFINEIVSNDIYFILTYKLGITNNSNDINYIVIDETIDINECYYVYNTLSYYEDYVKIWKIKTRDDLFFFNQADIYFLRGNYHKFYNIFIPLNCLTVFYPATSFKQNLKINKIETSINKYDVVLIHEDPKYNKFYNNNNCILFKKFTSDVFINLNVKRIYDFCFVATEVQTTKNHHLFLSFLEFLENNGYKYNIIFIGNLNVITND